MTGTALAAFVTTIFLMIITPGPAVMQVIGHSMTNGWKPTQASIFGIVAANAMYCTLSVLGLGAVILMVPSVFEIIKWCGVTYLGWIGVKALWSALRPTKLATVPTLQACPLTLFRQSFILQGANPKSVLFFCALLPVFAGEASAASTRIAILGVVAIVMEYPILLTYSLLAAQAARWFSTSTQGQRLLNGLSGTALLVAACSVATATLRKEAGV